MKKSISTCTPMLFALITFFTFSCTKYQIPGEQEPGNRQADPISPVDPLVSTCDPDTVYFQNTILPLVVSSCATTGCHDRESHRDGIILMDYASIIQTGKIKPGNPGDSEFFESLTDSDDDLMPPPPYDPLNSDQITAQLSLHYGVLLTLGEFINLVFRSLL